MLTRTDSITPKQCALLTRLIGRTGKAQYIECKRRLGLSRKPLMKLSKSEANALIALLDQAGRR